MSIKSRNFWKRSMGLGESIRRTKKDMESVWMDQVEKSDLQDVKNHMKEVEDALCMIQEEVGHIEAKHCKS
jgi:peptidyl-tRNA hydrolase